MTTQIFCDDIPLRAPQPVADIFPSWNYESFPDDCCGAGQGLQEKLVPDYVLWGARFLRWFGFDLSIKISPACWIHDRDWEFASPCWDAFHDGNSRLYANIKSIVMARTSPGVIRDHALKYPAIYIMGVEDFGRRIFWQIKKDQGFDIPVSAAWLLR